MVYCWCKWLELVSYISCRIGLEKLCFAEFQKTCQFCRPWDKWCSRFERMDVDTIRPVGCWNATQVTIKKYLTWPPYASMVVCNRETALSENIYWTPQHIYGVSRPKSFWSFHDEQESSSWKWLREPFWKLANSLNKDIAGLNCAEYDVSVLMELFCAIQYVKNKLCLHENDVLEMHCD